MKSVITSSMRQGKTISLFGVILVSLLLITSVSIRSLAQEANSTTPPETVTEPENPVTPETPNEGTEQPASTNETPAETPAGESTETNASNEAAINETTTNEAAAEVNNTITNETPSTTSNEVNQTVDTEVNANQEQTSETIETGSATIFVKEWYPKGKDYVFVCNAGFSATTYDWFYGDGHKLLGITNGDTYHIYDVDGDYTVSCTAYGNGQSATATMQVQARGGQSQPQVSQIDPTLGNTTFPSNTQNPSTNDTMMFHAILNGNNEVPPVATSGTGTATVTITGNTMHVTGMFQNLISDLHMVSGSPAHIHFAPLGQNGPVIWPLSVSLNDTDTRSGFVSLTADITEEQKMNFINGLAYINIHTEQYPAGEIRGQFTPMNAVQEANFDNHPAGTTNATGTNTTPSTSSTISVVVPQQSAAVDTGVETPGDTITMLLVGSSSTASLAEELVYTLASTLYSQLNTVGE